MTIANLALARDRALIVTDSLLADAFEPLHVSKAASFPHLRLAVASTGMHHISLKFLIMLSIGTPHGADILDVAELAPDYLRKAAARESGLDRALLFIVGNPRATEEVVAFMLNSHYDFTPTRLTPGCYLSPGIEPDDEKVIEPPRTPRVAEVPVIPLTPEQEQKAWRGNEYSALASVATQKRQAKVPIGGPLVSTHIDCYGCWQRYLRDLDEDE